jgi:hypothetical protein
MTELHIEGHISKKFDILIEPSPIPTLCIYTDHLTLYFEAADCQLIDVYTALKEHLESRGMLDD